ncbi:MAG: putative transrane protein [Polaromonas sp.]|nr:putative transrane protein [Polaromonas sp.]
MLWRLKRDRSHSVAQLGWFYLTLCLGCLGIAAVSWSQDAALLMTLALLALGAALVVYSRHAGDGEKIVLQGGQLVIELETAGRTERAAFNREWVRVEPKHGDGSLIEVSGQGRLVRVGRHMRPELRPLLAREIRIALRTC